MTTRYFILTKSDSDQIHKNEQNQIILPNQQSLIFLLPENNLTYYYQRGLFESTLIEWSKQFCSKTKKFLDIGAHTGTYSLALAKYSKEVFSFEPQRNTYYALCGSVALSGLQNVVCVNCGLGSEEQVGSGKTELKIVSNDGGGSSLHAKEGILRTEMVEIKTLDSFKLDEVGFIKMDVEDNELFVLKGAVKTLKDSNYPTILFEANDESKSKNLFEFIQIIGYKIVKITGYNNMFLAEKVK